MDTIASMRAFVAVAKTGSFGAAAQKLDLVPSVITKRVTQLEPIVGTTPFHRSTRKGVSTEHGLDQEFNSLDAQYDAASAYIKSQAHAGWTLIRSRYDDGGYSGGSTDRPDLQRLLDDIRARK